MNESASKYVITALCSIVATGAFGWLAGARDFVSRSEVAGLMQTTGPYIEDRQALKVGLERNTQAVDRMADKMGEMTREQAALRVMVGQLRREAKGGDNE